MKTLSQHPHHKSEEEELSCFPKHIALIIPSLTAGGAERVAVRMANYWMEKKRDVTIFTFDDGSEPPFYDLVDAVDLHPLDLEGASTTFTERVLSNGKRIRRLRTALNQLSPDVVITFMPSANVLTILAGIGTSWPVVVTEHANPDLYPIVEAWDVLRRWTYPFAAAFVGVSRPVLEYFSSSVREKGVVIHNPVVPRREEVGTVPPPENREKVICAMGRLERQKGFDLLIRSFSKIKDLHPDWCLEVWGEGEQRQELETLKSELSLDERVAFPGLTKTPFEQMKRAAFFGLPSRSEGFGNVLAEALACGLPVVAFDCPSGPSEIVRPGVDGELVPPENVDAFAGTLHALIENKERRRQYARRAPEVRNRLGTDAVMDDWNKLISDVCRSQK